MSELKCQACGNFGYDVQPRVVEVSPDRTIRLYVDSPAVPERYKVEARCIDKEACQDRQWEARSA